MNDFKNWLMTPRVKKIKNKNEKGIALVSLAIFLVVLLGLTALAVELGFAYTLSNELKSVADAGALTAAQSYLQELQKANNESRSVDFETVETNVRAQVQGIIGRSRVLKISSSPSVSLEIAYGTFTPGSESYHENSGTQFTDLTADLKNGNASFKEISAFRVRTHRGNSASNQLPLDFAKIWDIKNFSVSRESVATFAPRDFMLVIDTSGSMDDITYPRPAGQVPQPPWNPKESFIIFPPLQSDPTTPWYSPYASGPTDRFSNFDSIIPQPIQTVLDSSFSFLEDLEKISSFGDKAGVEYFSQSPSVKLTLTPITEPKLTENFKPLLSNDTLYQNLIKVAPGTSPPHYILKPGISNFDFDTNQYEGPIAIPNGHTNIGDAIEKAVSTLSQTNSDETQSIPVIILFTDGQPNCAPEPENPPGAVRCFGSSATEDELRRARVYTFEKARKAIEQGIVIYPISYGNLDDASKTLLDEIAYLSGLKDGHYQVGTTTDLGEIKTKLKQIFTEISQLIPFKLAG